MTDEQIIKALECCTKKYGCCDCPLENDELCMITINKEALSLIKRQQAEIERLEADREALINGQITLQKMYAEAIKKFAEKIKERKYQSSDWSHGEHPFVVEEDDIDDVLLKMTEGSNEV